MSLKCTCTHFTNKNKHFIIVTMKTFQSKNISQPLLTRPPKLSRSQVSSSFSDNKENYYKFASVTSNSITTKNLNFNNPVTTWDTSLDKELNKILHETLNFQDKENDSLFDNHNRGTRDLKRPHCELETQEFRNQVFNDIKELHDLELPNAKVEHSRVGKYSVPQFLKLVETNHMLCTKIHEIQNSINIYNVKKSIIIDRLLDKLQCEILDRNRHVLNDRIDNATNDFNNLFTTSLISKQELNDTNEEESVNETLQSDSECSV